MPVDDREIIALFYARDEQAVSQTAAKFSAYCHAIAARILQNPEDAEEALNDTWLAAWNAIPPHNPSCLRTFLGRLTRNISMMKLRAGQTVKRGGTELRLVWEELADGLSSGQDVEQEVSRRELTAAINVFLGTLPDTERKVFVRRYLYMQPVAEIADAHGFSVSKVKSMLLRTRKKLFATLKKEGFL